MKIMKRNVITLVSGLVLLFFTSQDLIAGWFQSSRIETVYASSDEGTLGIKLNGVPLGVDIILQEDVEYTILYCGGFAIRCSYDTPVIIR